MSSRVAVLATLAVPALLVAGALVPGTWLWGVHELRYLGSAGWIGFAVGLLAIGWSVGLRTPRSAGSPGADALAAPSAFLLVAAGAALVVLAFPDRLHFVGDALLRLRSAESGASPRHFYPQSLPLDRALHWYLPRFLYEHFALSHAWTHRLVGAAGAATLAMLALALSRAAGWRGAAALAGTAVVFFGGWLTLFTGLGKGFAELTVLTLGVAVAGLALVRSGRGKLAMGFLLALALLTHRSALALVPGAVAALLLARPRTGIGIGASRWGRILAWSLPALALAAVTPTLWRSGRSLDLANFGLAAGGREPFYHPLHLLDLSQVLLYLVPAIPLLLWWRRGEAPTTLARRERIFLAAYALPFLALALLYLPPQGLFRDYDGVSAAGMALAVVLAHHLAARLGDAPLRAAAGIALWCALPTLGWLALAALPERGLERVEDLALGPPERSAVVRGYAWDYLGSVHFDAGRYAESAAVLARGAEAAPSPRMLSAWAEAARRARDWPQAERAYALLLERAPEEPAHFRVLAHMGLASAAGRRGELEVARHHLEAVLTIEPSHPDALRLLAQVHALSSAGKEEKSTP